MRLFPILTAVLVMTVLYFLVFEREQLVQLAGGGAPTEESAEPAPAESATAEASTAPSEPAAETDVLQRVSVVVLESTAGAIDRAVLLRGRTEAARQVDVRAETTGLIVSEPLRKGAFVEAGQLMCEIDPGTREATLAEARARLAEARAGLPAAEARVTEAAARLAEAEINNTAASRLSEGGFASETRVASTVAAFESARASVETARSGQESATAAVQAAEATVALAEREIERLQITAPFSGILETDTAELGALMQQGSACATILQLDPIKLVGFVPEADVTRVELGSRAGARLISGDEILGEVTFISRSADPQTRTFRVEVTVPNADLAIRDGQTAEMAIESAGAAAHLVPASALTLDDNGTLGLRIVETDPEKGDIAAFRAISLLRDVPEGVYVTGLPETARVIIVGQEYVTDGVPVSAHAPSSQSVTQ